MSALQGSQTVEIGKLREYYVWEVLKIPKGHQYETNMLMLLHLARAEATKKSSRSVEVSSLMEQYHLPPEVEPKLNELISKNVDQRIQAILENGYLTSGMDGTGMTGVVVGMGMGLAPSGGGGQGQGMMDPAEQEPAQKRSRIEHSESDCDEGHNLKNATTAQEKVGIMVRLMQ